MNATKYARIAEVTSLDGSIAVTLAAHQAIGLKVNRYFSITSKLPIFALLLSLVDWKIVGKLPGNYFTIKQEGRERVCARLQPALKTDSTSRKECVP